ncbi:hypothetical protein DPMN_132162 [Dreissena polymorpha]|uniref:Uncharacterized protein n=1 Tax=Dreissena polymorpha TaxID=45954 RepID=A0A9D4FSU0_DREPO|nr:hypothetical protein DPMN_132162 [Dreissena polymorpha]
MSTEHINRTLGGDGFFFLLNIPIKCNTIVVVFSELCISKQELEYIGFQLAFSLVARFRMFVLNFGFFFANSFYEFSEATADDKTISTDANEDRADNLAKQPGYSKNATAYIDNQTNDTTSMFINNDNMTSQNGRTIDDLNTTDAIENTGNSYKEKTGLNTNTNAYNDLPKGPPDGKALKAECCLHKKEDNNSPHGNNKSSNQDVLRKKTGQTDCRKLIFVGFQLISEPEKQYQESDKSKENYFQTKSLGKTWICGPDESHGKNPLVDIPVGLSDTEERLQESSPIYNVVSNLVGTNQRTYNSIANKKMRSMCEQCLMSKSEMRSKVNVSIKSNHEGIPVEEDDGKYLPTETTDCLVIKILSSKFINNAPSKKTNLYASWDTSNLRCIVFKDTPTPKDVSLYPLNELRKHDKKESRKIITEHAHAHATHKVLNDFKFETKLSEQMSVEQEVKQIINHLGCTCAQGPRELFLLPLMRGEEVDDPVEQLQRIVDTTVRGEPVPPQESMRFELLRSCTYRMFPKDGKPDVRKYAEAGFYYASNSDEVICYCCYKRISNWKADDDPIAVHRNISPTCRFHIDNSTVNVAKEVTAHVETEIMAQIQGGRQRNIPPHSSLLPTSQNAPRQTNVPNVTMSQRGDTSLPEYQPPVSTRELAKYQSMMPQMSRCETASSCRPQFQTGISVPQDNFRIPVINTKAVQPSEDEAEQVVYIGEIVGESHSQIGEVLTQVTSALSRADLFRAPGDTLYRLC